MVGEKNGGDRSGVNELLSSIRNASERRQNQALESKRAVGRGSILIVDDDADFAGLMRDLLVHFGHQAEIALDAHDALATAASFTPDAAFLDIGLPGMDGFELARRLRATAGLSGIKLVAVSGWCVADVSPKGEDGFDHHLLKPVEARPLERLLASLFGPASL